ncbi:MAG TPA: hypothetical protein VH475_04505 [Tepidisphaeraceae bacterium]|jgi:hypothetical protein
MRTDTSQPLFVGIVWGALLAIATFGAGGCISMGSLTPGQMDWVQPRSEAPRAGTVYLLRGWVGVFSGGIDVLSEKIQRDGLTARVFQHDQCQELARTMAERYRAAKDPEPICLIGHSFGADDALVIARELDKVGVPVDMVVTLDTVDQRQVPKNVKACYNYYQPGIFGGSNFLRGIPLTPEPGSTGQLFNVNLLEEGKALRAWDTTHVNIDEAPKVHQAIIEHLLAICPERAAWVAAHSGQRDPKFASTPVLEGARTAAGRIAPARDQASRDGASAR